MKTTILLLTLLSFNLLLSQDVIFNEIKYKKEIELKISKLEKENDSLQKTLSTFLINDYKSIEVIDKVNNYYENAWTKLIYMLSIIGGIMVVILPIFLTIQQKNELKTNKLDFQEDVDRKIGELENRIIEFNKEEIEKVRIEMNNIHKKINDRQESDIEKLYAMSYFLQGIHAISVKDTNLIIDSFIKSIQALINAKVRTNLLQCLIHLDNGLSQKVKEEEKLKSINIIYIKNILLKVRELFGEEFDEILNSIEFKINQLE